MEEAINAFTWMDKFFAFCAILGGLLFLARMVLMFLGAHDGMDVDAHGDFGAGHGDAGHTDTDMSFKLLTFQGLTAFFMMFGLVGLGMHYQSGMGTTISVFAAMAAGVGSMWIIARIFALMMRLEESGTLDLKQAIGEEGTVYLNIPADGTGKVQVAVDDRLREFEAYAKDKIEIKTGERVKVVWIDSDDVLVVEKI